MKKYISPEVQIVDILTKDIMTLSPVSSADGDDVYITLDY